MSKEPQKARQYILNDYCLKNTLRVLLAKFIQSQLLLLFNLKNNPLTLRTPIPSIPC